MSVDRARAAAELGDKLRLEALLRRALRSVSRRVAREVAREVARVSTLPDVASLHASLLLPLFLPHYRRVASKFDSGTRERLPSDVAMTSDEARLVERTLAELAEARAPRQAREIGETTQRDAEASLTIAREEQRRLQGEGQDVTESDVGMITGSVLDRRLRGREGSIACYETQFFAEASKQTEVDALLGITPSVVSAAVGAVTASAGTVKEWVTQGDSRVRDWHLAVDSDQVEETEPFIVRGERLMHPGDTSLGASLDNVINCRCSAAHDVEAIASSRQRRAS